MSGFSAEWLALRAPADDAARDAGLADRLVEWAAGRALTVADLGGGAGAAHRALAPHLPGASWRVLDDDPELLALLPDGAEAVEADLAAGLDAAFEPRPDLVTCFAFLDLVSAAWLERLADRVAAAGAALYAPLTYDGREVWLPKPPHEAEALAAFHADMRRDKGFGPALGPDAPAAVATALSARGYRVETADSAWRLTRGALMDALAAGSAEAVLASLPADRRPAWRQGRAAADSAMIGHRDILALPA